MMFACHIVAPPDEAISSEQEAQERRGGPSHAFSI
jgi:hypothetical protein